MENYKELLINSIKVSYDAYVEHGARSNKKILPIHETVADILKSIWGDDYEYKYATLNKDNKEINVPGKYYDKMIDITILKNGDPILCFGVKFVTSNYKQNSNNYFESMLGETANIQATGNKLPYFHMIVLPHKLPYFSKGSGKIREKTIEKIEEVNEHDIRKYIRLAFDVPYPHQPKALGILVVDLDIDSLKINDAYNTSGIFSDNFNKSFINKLSMDNLFEEIKKYKTYIESE